ncbi:MAG: NAD-dependent deacetylase [Gemmatimonadales bacterium]
MLRELDRAVEQLAGARRLLVVTGAGMSRDSGIPTFRDSLTGLWSKFDPQELATEPAFRRNPARVFGWYLTRWRQVREVEPHPGYYALIRLAERLDRLTIATQNVDGLHSRAGSSDVIELHGSLSAFRCIDRGHRYEATNLEDITVPDDGVVEPPSCSDCGSPIRPGVVWFGEPLPGEAVERAWSAVEQCDAMLVVGTSALVYPAAELPEIALSRDCPVIEINPTATPVTASATAWLAERAAVALPTLVERLTATRTVVR